MSRKTFQPFMVIISLFLLIGCNLSSPEVDIFIAQGSMTGEITSSSAILQTRLTAAPSLVDGDVPGQTGIARFEIDTTPEFINPIITNWINASPDNDYIVKWMVDHLFEDTRYYYRVLFTTNRLSIYQGGVNTFKTLPGAERESEISLVVVTGMNYAKFHYGKGNKDEPDENAYRERDKHLGFPGLEAMLDLNPDFMIATGDNVYYDSPGGEKWSATTQNALRKKWHEQFVQQRFIEFFSKIPVYWEKDDHDFRFNDCDTTGPEPPISDLGIATFHEQVPVVTPGYPNLKTYRTHRINKHLQIWLTEGRDFRSPNDMKDGPGKTLWGKEQIDWLKETLLASDATFKILISPTPLIGPDDAYKKDNHTNPGGFQFERDEFFKWLLENDFQNDNFYVVCGDRHWQYHSIHPFGFEEFSTGALVDANSRAGRLPGDPESTDPDRAIVQPYVQGTGENSGGFLNIRVHTESDGPTAIFSFFDEKGVLLYNCRKVPKRPD